MREVGFEPTQALSTQDLKSCPFDHSGTPAQKYLNFKPYKFIENLGLNLFFRLELYEADNNLIFYKLAI